MLKGRFLSAVQEYALQLVLVSESFDKREAFLNELRLSLITNDPSKITQVFPQWGSRQREEAQASDIEDSAGTWEFEEFDPHKAEDILAQLLADTSGTMSMADLGPDEGWK